MLPTYYISKAKLHSVDNSAIKKFLILSVQEKADSRAISFASQISRCFGLDMKHSLQGLYHTK